VTRLLIVEDEEAILSAMRRGFEFEGYTVATASDGQSALRAVRRSRPDLVILDLMLPKLSGMRVCERLRDDEAPIPIIMLTARDQEADKVLGLRAGADDYVTKPFSFLELLARVEAVLRRARAGDTGGAEPALRLDAKRMEVWKSGRALPLSRREFLIVEHFVNHAGEIVTRDQLLDAVWGYNAFPFTRTVDTHIAKLRKKVEDDASHPSLIVTIHGVGYKYTG
jgi:two-component system alkaline phosphatase synthesis response regulator PhoP